jgi:peptidoglycan/LPS O-acetylase OafA/YrhL/lysophospholipase L1-like esterase
MPEPARGDQKYLPGLDGLRALAVAAVVAYHLGYGWAQGGLLGVGVFFTLSGYLITDILVGQWAAKGSIKLGDFWLRRARRLLPALFVMLAVVTIWVNGFARTFVPGFRGNVIASVFYASNWWFIGQHTSYYARFAPPTPLDHLWSLAVEEQFYLVWPWVVLLMVWLASRGRKRRAKAALAGGASMPARAGAPFLSRANRIVLALVTLVLAAASALLMVKLYDPGYDPTRIYEGTDTRAAGLLIGAALAIVWPTRRLAANGSPAAWRVPAAARWLLDGAGLAGLAVIFLLVWKTNEYSGFMFHGGLIILSVATAAVLAAAVTPGSLIGQALGVQPLRWLGVRSYGIYLWHYPIIVLTAAPGTAGTPVSAVRAIAVVAATIIAAALSWRFVEDPIRSGARLRWIAPGRAGGHAGPTTSTAGGTAMTDGSGTGGGQRPGWLRRPSSPPAIAGVCLLVAAVLAGGVTAGVRLSDDNNSHPVASTDTASPASARLSNTAGQAKAAGSGAKQQGAGTAAGGSHVGAASGSQAGTGAVTVAAAGPAATVAALPTPPPMSSCPEVVHIGDSTSEGLISADYEPNPADRITARYADVGIKKSVMKIVGATSIVESLPGTPNAFTMAQQVKKSGFNGCWVLALGTNDTADVAVGSEVGRVQRVQQMMNLIGKTQPVMWVEVVSILKSGPYSEQNMQDWNDALKQVAPQYPNMRIYNWPAVVQKPWFINDGIHYTSEGYKQRGIAIADALAGFFPAKS